MNKKNYIINATILLLATCIAIYFIFFKNTYDKWMTDILNADSYSVTMTKCNDTEVTLPNNVVQEIFDNWSKASDNGPWTSNNNSCYDKVNITYIKNNKINNREILLISKDNIVTHLDGMDKYFVNTKEINNYLYKVYEQSK